MEYEATCVRDVKKKLSDEEKKVLKMHPKFSTLEPLHEGGLDFDQELLYAKLRITRHKEIGEQLEEIDENEEMQLTPEEQEYMDEQDAKSRLTFDPVDKIYDDRKRWVTDLKECSRVTLPTKDETLVEMRRDIHTRIFQHLQIRKMRQEWRAETEFDRGGAGRIKISEKEN